MKQYIPKSALVAEIEKLVDKGKYHEEYDCAYRDGNNGALYALKNKLDTLEVKEEEESKLPNPRFPHLDNIVDKVFGTSNLESFEYDDAEQLVLLAKEELLKDLEVKEVDLNKAIDDYIYTRNGRKRMALEHDWEQCIITFNKGKIIDFAKHFFELGLKAQKGDNM